MIQITKQQIDVHGWTRQLLHSNIITIESDVVLTLTADDYMLIIGL